MSTVKCLRLWPLLALLALGGCQYGLPEASSRADLAQGRVILVGKVELDPPLAKDEQDLRLGERGQGNLINLLTSPTQTTMDPDKLGMGDYRTAIKAPLGSEFFVVAPHAQANIRGAMLYMHGGDQIFFPGGLRYAAGEQDKAIYIGTIRYRRNAFYEIVGMDVIDEYARANAAFNKRFGGSMKLRKALLKPAR